MDPRGPCSKEHRADRPDGSRQDGGGQPACQSGSTSPSPTPTTRSKLAAGQTVSEIFAEHGEPYFRQGESRVIARLLKAGPQVLATGGGAYMDARTRANIKARGISIWLKAELPVLLHRVRRRDNRPLLASDDPDKVMRELDGKALSHLCRGRYHRGEPGRGP